MPPPASTHDQAFGKWSRPRGVVDRGVRPNSPIHRIVVLSSRPRSSSSVMSVAQPASSSRRQTFHAAEVVGVRVPAESVAERDFDERHAALDEPAGEQAALAEQARSVAAADFVRFVGQVERGPHFGPHHVGGLLVRAVVDVERRSAVALRGTFAPSRSTIPFGAIAASA